MVKSKDYDRWLKSQTYEKFVAHVCRNLTRESKGKVKRNQQLGGKKTGHSHQIDVTIELQVGGLELLVLVECKHYNKRVSVDDLLVFAQRIEDIGAHKGLGGVPAGRNQGS